MSNQSLQSKDSKSQCQFYIKKVNQPYKYNHINNKVSSVEKKNVQNYLEKIIKKETILKNVLQFLDVFSLENLASVNSKLRMIVKHFIINYSSEQVLDISNNQLTSESFLAHIQRKLKFSQNVDQITASDLNEINQPKFKECLNILYFALKSYGYNVYNISFVIPMIIQYGIQSIFQNEFQLSSEIDRTLIKDDYNPTFHKSQSLSKNINKLLRIVSESIEYKRILNPVQYQKYQQVIINRIQIVNSKKIVQSVIQPLNFRKGKNIYSYLNKNNLSLIMSFLDFNSINNLRNASKQLYQIISISLENHLQNLNWQRVEEMKRINLSEQDLESIIIHLNYYYLEYNLSIQVIDKLISISLTEKIISILKNISKIYENAKYQKNKQKIQKVLNLKENVYAVYLQACVLNKKKRLEFNPQYSKQSTDFYKYLCEIDLKLKQNKYEINFLNQTAFIHKLYPILQQITYFQHLINRNPSIPLIYSKQFKRLMEESKLASIQQQKQYKQLIIQ